MILIHSQNHNAKQRLAFFVQTQTGEPVVVAQTDDEIIPLAKTHRPTATFLHMPARPGTARDIQAALRAQQPAMRVRILPTVDKADREGADWQLVITKALYGTSLLSRKEDLS